MVNYSRFSWLLASISVGRNEEQYQLDPVSRTPDKVIPSNDLSELSREQAEALRQLLESARTGVTSSSDGSHQAPHEPVVRKQAVVTEDAESSGWALTICLTLAYTLAFAILIGTMALI